MIAHPKVFLAGYIVECPIFKRKNTKCDDMTSTTDFLVPFGPIFQIYFFFKFLVKNLKIFPNVVFDSSN